MRPLHLSEFDCTMKDLKDILELLDKLWFIDFEVDW